MRKGDMQIGATFHKVQKPFESSWSEPRDTLYGQLGSDHVTSEPGMVAPFSMYLGDGIRGGIEAGFFTFPTAVLGMKRNGYGAMAWLGYWSPESTTSISGGLALARSYWSNEFLDAGVFGYGALNQVERMKWDGAGEMLSVNHDGFRSFREFGAGTWMNIGGLWGGSIEGRLGYAFDGGGWKARMAASLDLGFRFEADGLSITETSGRDQSTRASWIPVGTPTWSTTPNTPFQSQTAQPMPCDSNASRASRSQALRTSSGALSWTPNSPQ